MEASDHLDTSRQQASCLWSESTAYQTEDRVKNLEWEILERHFDTAYTAMRACRVVKTKIEIRGQITECQKTTMCQMDEQPWKNAYTAVIG